MKLLLFISIYSLSVSSTTVAHFNAPWSITHDESPFVPSHHQDLVPSRAKRYVLRRKRWSTNRMTWSLLRNHITEADVYIIRNTLHRAFNDWSAVSNVQFDEVQEGESDLRVSFERGFHEDRYPFDGRDGIVAHAFYPRDGRLHFDADEEWTLNQSNGVNLYQTALHEIGHLIGLEHSNDPRAAMFASKRPYSPVFTLSDDDVRAARELFPYRDINTHSTIDTPPSSFTTPSTTTSLPITAQSSTVPSTVSSTPETTTETTTRIQSTTEQNIQTSTRSIDTQSITTTVSPMDRRPVFRLTPVFSSASRRNNSHSMQKPRLGPKRERVRSYSMLTLVDESIDLKKTSFFSQQAEPSSLNSFRL